LVGEIVVELDPGGGGPSVRDCGTEHGRRRLIVSGGRAELEHFAFWDGPADLAALPRALIHVAKIRYEAVVYGRDIAALRRRQHAVDEAVEDVLAVHRRIEERGASSGPLADAQSRLSRQVLESTGLLLAMSRLKELRRTVVTATANLEQAMPELVDDVDLGRWMVEQIGHDLEYADAVRSRAAETFQLTSLRLSQATEHEARVQNRLSLLQTTLLGALLAGLTTFSTLEGHVGNRLRLRLPIVALVMTLTFALPHLVIHWYQPYRTLDYAGAALLGAAIGWLALVIVSSRAPAWLGWLIAVATGAAALGTVIVINARVHPRPVT
jgi:hypothetical protein